MPILNQALIRAELQRLLKEAAPETDTSRLVVDEMSGPRFLCELGDASVTFSCAPLALHAGMPEFSARHLQPIVPRLLAPPEAEDDPECWVEHGTVIHLLTGSPPLTVVAIHDGFVVEVVWFRGAKFQTEMLPWWCFAPPANH